MAIKDTQNAETTDRASEDEEKKETPAPEQSQEPSLDKEAPEDQADREGDEDADEGAEEEPGDVLSDGKPQVSGDSGGGFGAGAAAVVSAGLGLSALVGTPLSDMLRSRKELIGQIESSTGAGGDQIEAFYSAPWHTAALVNGVFALLAAIVGAAVLALLAQRTADAKPWVRAVALGGVVLGALGLIVAGGMYFDLFANAPELPSTAS